jgi:hypothetical protein
VRASAPEWKSVPGQAVMRGKTVKKVLDFDTENWYDIKVAKNNSKIIVKFLLDEKKKRKNFLTDGNGYDNL